jgi:hypothetical protein
MAIDWSFISQKGIEGESEYLTGYVPSDTSGFTVGSFDIGQHSKEDVRSILQSYSNKLAGGGSFVGEIRQDLLDVVSPYALRKDIDDSTARAVKFKEKDIKYLTAAKRHSFEKSISGSKGDIWKNLDEKTQTILGSIGWQYGTGKNKKTGRNIFEEFWKIRDDKDAIHKKLIDMGKNEYPFRRGKEADYIQPPPLPVQETLNVDKNKEIFVE